MRITECLLCTNELQQTASWSQLFSKFPPMICMRCESQFEPVFDTIQINESLDVYCLYKYNEKMVDYLHRYKFMHDTVLAKVFQRSLYRSLKAKTIVPIPMHPEKIKERTFHHIELLLTEAGIVYQSLLTKMTTDTQSSKTREQRLQTTQFFEVIGAVQPIVYTLFDDIVTTGTTFLHAKKLLLQHGAKDVQCVALIKA